MNSITSKKHYLTNAMVDFENIFRTRISSVEDAGQDLIINMWVNPQTSEFALVERVETIVTYNLVADTFSIKVKGTGSRKYGKQIKSDVTGIINSLVETATNTYNGDVADATFMTQGYAHDKLQKAGYEVAVLNEMHVSIGHGKFSLDVIISVVEEMVANASNYEEKIVKSGNALNQDHVRVEVPELAEMKYFLTTGVVYSDTDKYAWAERGWIMEGYETDNENEFIINNPFNNFGHWELAKSEQILEITKEDYDFIYQLNCNEEGWGDEETDIWEEFTERLLSTANDTAIQEIESIPMTPHIVSCYSEMLCEYRLKTDICLDGFKGVRFIDFDREGYRIYYASNGYVMDALKKSYRVYEEENKKLA
ncbi:hypothetical protein ABEY65_28015 [Priestia aryabhattai]|uniref:hypothetical protein n=1 Tax=Priestia aryabhattai TaxID=412384 RepID=UPI003D2A2BF4